MAIASVASTTTSQLLTAATKAVVTDPRDTNKDGKVSGEEARQWALTHPPAQESASAEASAGDAAPGGSVSRVDISV